LLLSFITNNLSRDVGRSERGDDDDNATSKIEPHCTDTTTLRARALNAGHEQLRRRLFRAHYLSIVFAIIARAEKIVAPHVRQAPRTQPPRLVLYFHIFSVFQLGFFPSAFFIFIRTGEPKSATIVSIRETELVMAAAVVRIVRACSRSCVRVVLPRDILPGDDNTSKTLRGERPPPDGRRVILFVLYRKMAPVIPKLKAASTCKGFLSP